MFNKPRNVSPFTQEISIDDYTIGATNNDGSIFCWLCLIDEVYLDAYDPEETIPIMYSNKDFAEHIEFYHKVSYENWKEYKEYIPIHEWRFSSKKELRRRQEYEHKIMRTHLACDFARAWLVLELQNPLTKVDVCNYLYSLSPTSVISEKGYTVAAENKDGSLCCMLCLVDEIQYNSLDSEDKEKKEARKTMPAMYSNEDFAYHILKYHKPKPGKNMWEKYLPCLDYDEQAWKDSWHQKQDYDKIAEDIKKWHAEHPELVNEGAK
jgi:hypothetical protein